MQTNIKTQRLLLNISLRLASVNKTDNTEKILREYRKKKIYIDKK